MEKNTLGYFWATFVAQTWQWNYSITKLWLQKSFILLTQSKAGTVKPATREYIDLG